MKPRVGAPIVRLSPSPEGWRAQTGADECSGTTIAELVGKLPTKLRAELLLPSTAIVTERLTLPRAPREDLLSMAQLQLEKLLPYTAEDFVFDIEEVGSVGEDVLILAITVPLSELRNSADQLRNSGMGPVAVGVNAVQLARALAGSGNALALWQEGGSHFVLLAADGRLLWLEQLASEMAVLSGAMPERLDRAFIGVREWVGAARQALPSVVIDETPVDPRLEISGNWLPAAWADEASALTRKVRMLERLQWGVIGYAALLALGFCWLAFEKSRVAKLDRQIGELQPQVEATKGRQLRWRNLEAAVEPSRYLIEVLHQASKAIGGVDIRITEFQMNPKEFAFAAEASNVAEAIEYVGRLKKDAELASFKVESPNPNILPNDRAQFRVTGKVDTNASKK
jgi:hypothetical protein